MMMAAAPTATGSKSTTTSLPRLRTSSSSSSSPFTARIRTSGRLSSITRKQSPVFCTLLETRQIAATEHGDDSIGTSRREAVLQMAFSTMFQAAAAATVSSPALALDDAPAEFRVYSDDVNKYKISIPQEWEVGVGETDGIKSITAFYPQEASTLKVSVAITGYGGVT